MGPSPPAILALEDGRVFRGVSCGAAAEATGELVVHTTMTGHYELLSDPGACGQIVAFAHPQVGNCGVHPREGQSDGPRCQGLACRELCATPRRRRGDQRLGDLLAERGVPAIEGIDARALARHLDERGPLRACLSALEDDAETLVERARRSPVIDGLALAELVTVSEAAWWTAAGCSETPDPRDDGRPLAAVLDFGARRGLLRRLRSEGFRVRVLPARTPAAEVLALDPAGVVLAGGPGDPAALDFGVAAARELARQVPLLAIGLGHQLLGLAFGGRTVRLRPGHHGANHPVVDRRRGALEVTSQSHAFALDPASLPAGELEATHWSALDGTLEGMVHRRLPALGCQYHPEGSPGPRDGRRWFRAFREATRRRVPSSLTGTVR